MTQLRMDDDKDIKLENNKFSLTENNSDEEISQRLLQRLRFFLEEWFLDKTKGLPYFQLIFKKGTPPDIIESLNWQENDVLLWTENPNGSFTIQKQ